MPQFPEQYPENENPNTMSFVFSSASHRRTMTSLYRMMANPTTMGAVRNLNVHEYISMELMNAHGIATPLGYVASTPDEAEIIYQTEFAKRECGVKSCVVAGAGEFVAGIVLQARPHTTNNTQCTQ
jgi:hypothetical protein